MNWPNRRITMWRSISPLFCNAWASNECFNIFCYCICCLKRGIIVRWSLKISIRPLPRLRTKPLNQTNALCRLFFSSLLCLFFFCFSFCSRLTRLQGVKIKMDDAGNILIRRYSRNNVYVKSTANSSKDETAIGGEIQKLPNQALEIEKISKLFDVKKFQSNITRELKQAYPDRRRLELQCLSAIAFVRTESDILDCPIWVLVINVVAMDMLKTKMPPSKYHAFTIFSLFIVYYLFGRWNRCRAYWSIGSSSHVW